MTIAFARSKAPRQARSTKKWRPPVLNVYSPDRPDSVLWIKVPEGAVPRKRAAAPAYLAQNFHSRSKNAALKGPLSGRWELGTLDALLR